ncbi:Spermatogenesis-associated protein 31E1 [Manis javanica]|nr:Spermatogenesis-associated protein 31E1 [Manis javanica]
MFIDTEPLQLVCGAEPWFQPVMLLVPQHHLEPSGKKKCKKRSAVLKVCKESLCNLEEMKHLLLLLRRCEEISKAQGETPPGDGHVSSEAPLTTQESGPPAQTSTCMFVGRMWHSEMAMRAHRASRELSPGAATARIEPAGESRDRAARHPHRRATSLEGSSGSSSAEEDGGSVAAEEASAWKIILESRVPAHSQINNVDLSRSGTPETSKIPRLPGVKHVIQDLEEPHLHVHHSDSELHEKVESGKQPQDSGPSEPPRDSDAHVLLQHCHSREFLAADSSAFQRSLCSSQSTSSGDTSASHVSGDIMLRRWASGQSSQGSLRLEEQGESQSKMFAPAGDVKDCGRSDQVQLEKGLAELRASQHNGMLKNNYKETAQSLRSKSCQLGLKEEQAPPESHVTKLIKHFLQGILSSRVSQQKDRPPSATIQSQGQGISRSVPDGRAAKARDHDSCGTDPRGENHSSTWTSSLGVKLAEREIPGSSRQTWYHNLFSLKSKGE